VKVRYSSGDRDDLLVCIATGWTAGVRLPAEVRDSSLLRGVKTGSGAHPTSYSMDTGAFFPGGWAAGA
jgi:hypothetical protein